MKLDQERLGALVRLIAQLDAVRANHFVRPARLKENARATQVEPRLAQTIVGWDEFLDIIHKSFASTAPLVEALDRAKVLETPAGVLYALGMGYILVSGVSGGASLGALFSVTFVGLISVIRGGYWLLAVRPLRQLSDRVAERSPHFCDQLRTAIQALVDDLNHGVLTAGVRPSDFTCMLYHRDYAGLDMAPHLRFALAETWEAKPDTVHAMMPADPDLFRVSMPHLDDKLIQSLCSAPLGSRVELLTRPVEVQGAPFAQARVALGEALPNRVQIRTSAGALLSEQFIISRQGTWRLDRPARPAPGERVYVPFVDKSERESLEARFSSAWAAARPLDQKS